MDTVLHVLAHMPYFIFHWGHVVFGIAWIGLLYYFNFVQGGYMAAASDAGRVDAFTKLVPSALWWFRWAAMMTLLTGLVLLYFLHQDLSVGLVLGSLMGIVMFLNVWLIIWPNQKVVIASNEAVRDGGEADPGQGAAAAKALLASRTNTLFSLPMLYFMVSYWHAAGVHTPGDLSGGRMWLGVAIVAAIEANAIWGKTGPIATPKGVIWSSVALTVVMAFVIGFDTHVH